MAASVVIAGGGVAGLEAVLALQALGGDRVEITLLTPERHFTYRPLAVAEPFDGERVLRFPLATFARDRGIRLVRDAIAGVDSDARRIRTQDGQKLDYDFLVLATGARAVEAVPGAITFRGPRDGARIAALVADIEVEAVRDVVFVSPSGTTWSLPLYELALATAVAARRAGKPVRLSVVTPERAPLEVFGPEVSAEVTALLAASGIELYPQRLGRQASEGRLWMPIEGSLPADRVVALPRLVGRQVLGVPSDGEGFTRVDGFGRVAGLDRVHAVGDGTHHPLKQGGLATQQADAAAGSIAALLGADLTPAPYVPVLRAVLLTGDGVRYLRSAGDDGPAGVTEDAPWWPGAKIAGRYLAPYLADHLADAETPLAA